MSEVPVQVDKKYRGIVILEGADCSGKTTLADAIRRAAGAHGYEHCGISDDVWGLHIGVAGKAGHLSDDMLMIIDRLWLSEQVYGHAYRDGPAYDYGARFLDRCLTAAGAVTVLCVPSDFERQKAIHAERAAAGNEAFADAFPAMELYHRLCFGHENGVTKSSAKTPRSGTYLDELIRTYNPLCYTDRETVLPYDWMKQDVDAVARHVVELADRLHKPWVEAVNEAMI